MRVLKSDNEGLILSKLGSPTNEFPSEVGRQLYYYIVPISIKMKLLLFSLVLLLTPIMAYAQSLDDVNAMITDTQGDTVTVQFSWNNDDDVSYYEVGCVSCIPNIKQTTTENSITLHGVTLLEDDSVLLYVLAYDEGDTHISVKQILLTLKS